jgi:hypothetical protein
VNKAENVLWFMGLPSHYAEVYLAPVNLHSPFARASECGRLFTSEKEVPVTQITVDKPTTVKPEDS